jgi:hypothetical protein
MYATGIGVLALMALLWAGAGDPSGSGFRCGTRLVSIGESTSKVLQKCGQPSYIETWVEERIKRDFYKRIPAEPYEEFYREPFLVKEIINIEEWEYNLGPTQFIRYLRFENGRLIRITIGDYGY